MAQGLLDVVSQVGRGFEKIYDEQVPTMDEIRGLLGMPEDMSSDPAAQYTTGVPQPQRKPVGLLGVSPDQVAPGVGVEDMYNDLAAQHTAGEVASDSNIDWKLIGAFEGNRINGYVPKDNNGKVFGRSGVTIGTGVDLGSKNAAYFSSLDKAIRDKLSPYYGLRGNAAVTKLESTPLALTQDEVSKVNKLVKKAEIDNIRERWKNSTKSADLPASFDDLPKWMATPIASALFQHGTQTSSKDFWTLAIANDVPGMEKELRKFTTRKGTDGKMEYFNRRNAEADYLVGELKGTPTSEPGWRKIIQENSVNPIINSYHPF